jgi:hypothetical protein
VADPAPGNEVTEGRKEGRKGKERKGKEGRKEGKER